MTVEELKRLENLEKEVKELRELLENLMLDMETEKEHQRWLRDNN